MQGAATTYNQNTTLPKPVYSVKKEQPKNCANYTYFGARYYDSDLSVWLSVDPMSDKYPSLSPYNYCGQNPIGYVDYNGEDWIARTKSAKRATMDMILLTFGTTEGFSWKRGKLQFDEAIFNAASGPLSEDQLLAYEAFVKEGVLNKNVKVVVRKGYTNQSYIKNQHVPYGILAALGRKSKEIIMFCDDCDPELLSDVSDRDIERIAHNPVLRDHVLQFVEDPMVQRSVAIWHEYGHFFNWMKSGPLTDYNSYKTNYNMTIGFESILLRILLLPERQGNNHDIKGKSVPKF